jgi:hypothetical protein
MGTIHDLEATYPDEVVHRVTTENATLRRRVLQLGSLGEGEVHDQTNFSL